MRTKIATFLLLLCIAVILNPGSTLAAGSKISDLPSGAPLLGTDAAPFQRGAGNVKGTVDDIKDYVFDTVTTDDVTEGTNLFHTSERVDDRVNALLQDGSGYSWSYIDGSDTLTLMLDKVYTGDTTCSTDDTTALTTFLEANNGVAIMPPGCYLLTNLNPNSDLVLIEQIPGTVTYKNNAGDNAIAYDPGSYSATNTWDNLQLVTAIADNVDINVDDSLQCLSVASTSGYAIGDYVHIMDAGGLPSQMTSPKTVSAITRGATTTIDFTSSHGFSSSSTVYFYGVGGTTELNKKGWNLTVVDSDTITIQTMDGTTTGSAVDSTAWGAFTSGGLASTDNGWAGESNRVANVDPVGGRICLTHKLQYKSLYNTRPELRRWTKARKAIIQGGLWTANGDPRDPAIYDRAPLVTITGVVEPVVRSATFDLTWGQAVEFRGAPGFKYENNRISRMPNQATFDADGVSGGGTTEYSVSSATNATQGVFTTSASPAQLSNDDTVYVRSCAGGTWATLNAKLYRVSGLSGSTFKLKDMNDQYVNTSGLGTLTISTCGISEADVQGLGYGVLIYGPSFGGVIQNIDGFEARHLVTSGGGVTAWSTRSYFSGQPTYVTVKNITSNSAMGPVADLHEDSAAWTFQNITCNYAARGATGSSYSGMCGQFRGKNTTVDGWVQSGGSYGIRVTATQHEEDDYTVLKNIDIQNLARNNNDNSDIAIWLADQSAYSTVRYVFIDNLTAKNVGKVILNETKGRIRVGNAYVTGTDVFLDAEDGSETQVHELVADYRISPRNLDTNQIALMRSTVTYGGAKVGIDSLTLHRGVDTSSPSNVFSQQDTNATKYYWIGELIDDNYSGLTSTFPLLSSHTTMQLWDAYSKATFSPPKNVVNSTYTNTYLDAGRTIVFNRSSLQTVTLAKTMPVGWKAKFVRIGTGAVTWVAESGATVNSQNSIATITAQYGIAWVEVVSNTDGQTAVYQVSTSTPGREYCVAMSDQTTTLTAGTGKAVMYLPAAATVNSVRAYTATAPSGTLTIDINEAGTTLMSATKLTIDASEKTSGTAATAAVLSDTSLAANAELTFDIDGTTGGTGLVACINVSF